MNKSIENGCINNYPCIKYFTSGWGEIVVLFSEPERGTVIQTSDCDLWGLGDYIVGWGEPLFKPFKGSITLNNEVLNNAK